MLEVGGDLYLIDAGASVTHKLCDSDISVDKIKAAFFTHSHLDHMYGLADIMKAVNKRAQVSDKADYYFPEKFAIDAWTKYFTETVGTLNERLNIFHLYESGVIFSDENIKVTAILNAHMKKQGRPSYSFMIEAEGKRLVFSGDLSQELSEGDFPVVAKEELTDLLVLEYAHFDIEDMLPHLEECKLKRLCFYHISRPHEKLPLINALSDSGRFSFTVNAVSDGDEIDI
jgi:ribonuclease BN (tRNA processing enzyme)